MATTASAEPRADRNSLGKAAFIIGIIGLLMSFIPIIGFVAWLLCPLAILFGLIALRRPSKSLAIAGIVTGVIGLVICFSWISGTKAMGEAMSADTFNTSGETRDLANAPVMEANITEIWSDMEANKVAAGQKYGGNRLHFSNEEIMDFGGDASNPSIQFLGANDDYMQYFVSASFPETDGEKIAALSKGEAVSFTCNNISEGFGEGYNLSQCALD